MGTGEIGLPALTWLLDSPAWEVVAVVTQPDKPVGRKQELHPPAPKRLALERGVPVLQPLKMRAPEAVADIVALHADVIVVMAYGQILPKAVLDAALSAKENRLERPHPRTRYDELPDIDADGPDAIGSGDRSGQRRFDPAPGRR